jgi:hypothetical protein
MSHLVEGLSAPKILAKQDFVTLFVHESRENVDFIANQGRQYL